MSLQPAHDVPLLVSSPNSASERRVTPSWSISHLKTRLEPVTGIPASCQKLTLRIGSQAPVPLDAPNEDATLLSSFPLQPYAEIYRTTSFAERPLTRASSASFVIFFPTIPTNSAKQVDDTRPAAARTDFSDVSAVEKYVMPADEYETRSDSVLAWKKAQKLGRFDPNAPSIEEQKVKALEREVEERGITVGARCQLLPASTDGRRGTVSFIGPIPELPPPAGPWIGITLDEPTGKNDGSVKGGARYFQSKPNCGAFVRPEKVEVGDFPEVDEFAEEMEEI
ncbi:Tubulin-specific chaperone b (tubulin folding cofactor b) [Lasiodiplodia theobromae]|uniref:Tubulin-specific chaperone b (tubulin folding cofactor b) n=1 Tax=Lasiodiplodia theobromae TaxID=45133 RepID=UPI0015C2C283|nr:Tubulin-specific chaperone b (tubulin folding cofactor b) [Lasiodiplodia theobromae]KAF4544475.1 Tubulin-specific chaperone b (tubulin folding cofactor b) [Lasiodiplodia theobromae]